MQQGMQNTGINVQNQGQPMMSPQGISISHNQSIMNQNMSGQQQPTMNSIVMQQGGVQQQRPSSQTMGMTQNRLAMVSHGGPNNRTALSGQVQMVNAPPTQMMITGAGSMDHFSVSQQNNIGGAFPRTMGMGVQAHGMAFTGAASGQMNANDMMSPNESGLDKFVTNTD